MPAISEKAMRLLNKTIVVTGVASGKVLWHRF